MQKRRNKTAEWRADPFAARPTSDEYPPAYEAYVARVPAGNILATLEGQMAELLTLLRFAGPKQEVRDLLALMRFPEEDRGAWRYAPGEWSLREVLGHVTDTERVLAYRVLSAARGIAGELPLVRDEDLIAHAALDRFPLEVLMDDFTAVRHASLTLYASLDAEALSRRMIVGGDAVTARALVWMTAGHAYHHQAILREHYFGGVHPELIGAGGSRSKRSNRERGASRK